MARALALVSLPIVLAPAIALAHPGHGADGIVSGLTHPLSGLDHLLAMVGVGLLAAGFGRRRLWVLPAAFVACMTAGAAAGATGFLIPSWLAEGGIAASVVVLGLLVTSGARVPARATVGLVALFAVCHGSAHAAAMPSVATPAAYFAGFVAATVALHGAGIALGLVATRLDARAALRWYGAAMSACGLALLIGSL